MNQQLDRNADASANAVTEDVQQDDVAALMQQALEAAEAAAAAEDARWVKVTTMAGDITKMFDSALEQLTSLLNERYARETRGMDEELAVLGREHSELAESITTLKGLLPSMERESQREVDRLLLSGTLVAQSDAAQKLEELRELQHKPALLRQQQKECIARSEAIASEKRDIAKQVVEEWLVRVKPIIRSAENAFLITLLDGVEASLNSFRDATGTKVHPGYILELTSDAKSAPYQAGCKWYR